MRFSVITVCYNAANDIEDTMRSVLSQTFRDFEYLVIDGASSDGTLTTIHEVTGQYKQSGIPITVVSEPDKGISDAFNKGIKRAKGDIISLINAGDQLLPDALAYVDSQMSADILYGNIIWHDVQKGTKRIRKSSPDLRNLMYDMVIMHPATFVRRTAYEEVGLFDTTFRYCMDEELLVRMQQAGKHFEYRDKELVEMKTGGVSDNNTLAVLKEAQRIPLSYGKPRVVSTFSLIMKYVRTKLAKAYHHLRWIRMSYGK